MEEEEERLPPRTLKRARLALSQIGGCTGRTVLVCARVHNLRQCGTKLVFMALRQGSCTAQATLMASESISADTIRLLSRASLETMVEVEGEVVALAPGRKAKCTHEDIEIRISRIAILNQPTRSLPFAMNDITRVVHECGPQRSAALRDKIVATEDALDQSRKAQTSDVTELTGKLRQLQRELQMTQLPLPPASVLADNRVLTLRTPANHALFKINSSVCQLFREFLLDRHFTEIHCSRMRATQPGAGYPEFKLPYFDQEAYLVHSPHYLQGAICADFERVFEVGPEFRADAGATRRHLTEFTALSMEMAIYEHYHEACNHSHLLVDLVEDLFVWLIEGIKARNADDLAALHAQYPGLDDVVYASPSLRLSFEEAVALLDAATPGAQADRLGTDHYDLNFSDALQLARLVKLHHGVDFFIVDKSPEGDVPYYSRVLCPHDQRYANTFSVYLRGVKVCSGAQRIHDPQALEESARQRGVDASISNVLSDMLQYGAPPHAGCEIGLERLLMGLLDPTRNIRDFSLFSRCPHRLTP